MVIHYCREIVITACHSYNNIKKVKINKYNLTQLTISKKMK